MKVSNVINNVTELENVLGSPRESVAQKLTSQLDPHCEKFIKLSPLVFISTTDRSLNMDVSPKGDAPGFVHIADERTLLVPERPGNKLAYGFRNIMETGRVGLIFVVPGIRETLRINGSAVLSKDPDLLEQLSANNKPALLCTVVTIEECFMHCGKAMIRSNLWKPDSWNSNHDFSFAKQISYATSENEQELEQVLEEAYRERLY